MRFKYNLISVILFLGSANVFASQLTCDELGKLTQKAADMREQGHSYEVVKSLVGGYDYALDAAIKDVYTLKLTPKQAYNHANGLCSLAKKKGR